MKRRVKSCALAQQEQRRGGETSSQQVCELGTRTGGRGGGGSDTSSVMPLVTVQTPRNPDKDQGHGWAGKAEALDPAEHQ